MNTISSLKKLESKAVQIVKRTLQENAHIIEDMNTEDQLYEQGITREKVPIKSYAPYSPVTVQIKKQKGQPHNRVTLRDSEDFHKSVYVEFRSTEMEIKASDWKADMLTNSYGKEILGLTDDNFADLRDNYVRPALIKELI